MIVEVIGAPAAGKSSVTALIAKALDSRLVIQKNSKAMRNLPQKSWGDFLLANRDGEYAWQTYEYLHKWYVPDPSPEGDKVMADRVKEKTKERIGLYMTTKDFCGIFLWNRGITQVPIDEAMYCSRKSRVDYELFHALQWLFPKADLVVDVTVPCEEGWRRYKIRKAYKQSRRSLSKQYPGMTKDQYIQRYEIFLHMASRLDNRVMLDNAKNVQNDPNWGLLIKKINDY